MVEQNKQNCYEYFLECIRTDYGDLDYDAVKQFGHRIRRSEFVRHVDCLSAYFQKDLGLVRGDVYTVFLPTNIQSFAAFYALNKLGVIVNFVHPLSPPEVLAEAMADTKSKGILILDILAAKYIKVINESSTPCLVCSYSDYPGIVKKAGLRVFELFGALPTRRLKQRCSYRRAIRKYPPCEGLSGNGDDIAVYLHGGGTTGKSKTIKLTSGAINTVSFEVGKIGGVETPGTDSTIMVLPLFHAFGLCLAMHVPMCNGACIIPMSQFHPKRFNRLMQKNKIIFLVGIPVMFKKLMREDNFDGPHLKSLRLLFCGGDDVTEASLDEFNTCLEKWGSSGRLYRGYGLTEVASVCSVNTADNFMRHSIGKALNGVRMEIWDENKQPLPPGEVGEIVISGSTAMQGYFTLDKPGDEGLYTDSEGTKWVLSGDLGYTDEDGFFYFSGRKKRLIIISGYNVYPHDIDARVEELPFIREVCAAQGYANGKPLIRLYVSLKDSGRDEEHKKEIFRHCEAHLPSFSHPREIVVMDELPRTHMKKIDFMKLTEFAPKPTEEETDE